MNELIKRLMLVELRNKGFTQTRYDLEKDAILPSSDFPKIEMREKEIWWPLEENDPPYILGEKWYSREEREEMSRKLVYGPLLPILNKTAEMAGAWNNAPPMPIKDVAEFRLLSEYNKIVLAARDDGDRGLHFVTWEYSYDRKGVGHGHYTTNYEGAKKDFATRSGLIQEDILFQPEQLKQIYFALLFQGRHDDELTFTTEKELHDVIKKLENMYPKLKAQSDHPEPEQEVEL